ncbi:malate synthase A [Modestobacter sp. I12A-02628]|uniref:Malate synthase n=1 Tax=Goekera deserti TaxID=2497753 RepID=A0A7K3W9A4_9ACTN|nr:malate synthase A [Goekera deserti]MPQ98751.1 malate synthase A [Goekera deserti]NDI49314.1 malate synthase A [Goekera deserti]NEL53055.1 malate synthase A [Goekera deserti]
MSTVDGVEITGPMGPRFEEVLSPRALELIALLHRELGGRRRERLEARQERVRALAAGGTLDFLPDTAHIRDDDSWRVAEPAPGLVDRRVEMTGPTDRKMTINALNSGAKCWLADQEDANSPLWENVVNGPLNLMDSIDRTIDFTNDAGKSYTLKPDDELPTIIVRPRGWHLPEKHVTVDGETASGSLVDFALYLVSCGQKQIDRGQGPYFYLPKMESHLEARLWNDAFLLAQDHLGIPRGTIRATCLIETYPAAFEMEEILYELREHSSGLNAGRWDYLFSVIKTFRTRGEDFTLPDRNSITMTVPFMRAYTELLVRTCHKRGAHAMGGMSAFIPSKDPAKNEFAYNKITEDKTREAGDGFDGSWVAHPGMVQTAMDAFDEVLGDEPNQLGKLREDVHVTAADLLNVKATPGEVTEAGLRANISVGVQYVESWLRGSGAAGINGLMEDAATAEISRSQVWQWLNNQVRLADGQAVTRELVERLIEEEMAVIADARGDAFAGGRWDDARALFTEMALSEEYHDFLTVPAYERMP